MPGNSLLDRSDPGGTTGPGGISGPGGTSGPGGVSGITGIIRRHLDLRRQKELIIFIYFRK